MSENLIAQSIGREAFEQLCGWVGGGDYNIPAHPDTPGYAELAERIGVYAAERLVRWGAGSRVYVPYLYAVQLLRRRDELLQMRDQGMTIAEIARSYRYHGRYTERQVRSVLALADGGAEGVQADQIPLL